MIRNLLLFFGVAGMLTVPAWGFVGGGIGVRGGLVSNYQPGGDPTGARIPKKLNMVGGHTSFSPAPPLMLEASLEYNWKEENASDPIFGSYKTKINDYSANASAKLRLPTGALKPYGGGGVGLHRLVYSVSSSFGLVSAPDDVTKPAYHAMAGVAFAPLLAPFEIFGEYRWTWIFTDDKKTEFPTLLAGLTLKI
ncbi:MAG: porin family protein [candidate division Zixibacteria bacterium]|nr:porin family protein [candidate division Zixibacteria bacterium]